MANLSKQFYKSDLSDCLLTNLDISQSQKEELIDARKIIRNHLRSGVEVFSTTESGGGKKITPKFYTQGSWAYKTVNSPCVVPPQQVDYDDGMYLPVSYLDDNGPEVAAKVYFELIDSLLFELCKNKKWELDRSKKTCSRVVISSTSHFDIPLYSIPDKDFSAMLERVAKEKMG